MCPPLGPPTTPASHPAPLFSAAASTTVSHEGGGGSSGGGGTTRATPFPPSPAPSNAHTPLSPTSAVHPSSGVPASGHAGNGNNNNNNHAGQLSKIVIAQVFLLLSTIKEDKDRTKWDSQAEQIRKVEDIRRFRHSTSHVHALECNFARPL